MGNELDMMTFKEACTLLKVSESTLRRAIKRGEFPSPVKIGTRLIWDKSDIRKWIDDQKE